MLAGRKRRDQEISMARFALCNEELTTSLGVAIDRQLTWKEHVKSMRQKCFVGLIKLRRIGTNDQLTRDLERKVEAIQNVGMRIIINAPRMATGTEMKQKLGWCPLAQRRKLHSLNWPIDVSTMLALHTSITSSDTPQMFENRTVPEW